VFTDLDGALLVPDYSWGAVAKVLENMKAAGVPIILCSSKTRAEIEHYRKAMGIADPFISENGACVFIPDGYFEFEFPFTREAGGYKLIELGRPYSEISAKISELRGAQGIGQITCFSDMTDEELSKDSKLPLELARLAKMREYSESFKYSGDIGALTEASKNTGLSLAFGGRYWGASGGSDKGVATRALTALFLKKYGSVKTIGLGDSANDVPMLMAVDSPVLMMKSNGTYENADIPNLQKSQRTGPEGWGKKVLSMLLKDMVSGSARAAAAPSVNPASEPSGK